MMALQSDYSAANKEVVRINDCGIVADSWRKYVDRKNIVLQFLGNNLSVDILKHYETRLELLKKSSYYIDVLPKHMVLGDQNLFQPNVLYHLIDPCKFLRMKKIGTTQVKIQLLLLREYLSELKYGREELKVIAKISDVTLFLLHWNTTCSRLGHLFNTLKNFISVLVPGKLYVKHHLMSDAKSNKIPELRVLLSTKMPVLFDRRESVAYHNSVELKWLVLGEEAHHDLYELAYKLLEPRYCTEKNQFGVISVESGSIEIGNLLPDSSYEFSIRRAENYTLVYSAWCDVMVLKTKASIHLQYVGKKSCHFT
ncbi:LOW QUALITY PROTEIN: fibronectin type III domain-containing protein 11-like [Leucoraja erinacea]|uniref:LOW QUALITY PROTEIN: fibronectin type III domain-containing protein 11-like n=1 Tax=Leucoraja erinaceus TaxID=7782 RepID=UPI002455D0DB|nr:LOW QUALITY PROTEIN: fibronectin type III domain-containing protein 11-like [Leucoraja erinacea]